MAAVARVQARRAEAHAHDAERRSRVRHRQPEDVLPDRLGDLDRAVAVGAGEDDRELLAAVAGRHVAGSAQVAPEAGGQRRQRFVAGDVAARVVEGFEPVGVDHQERERRALPGGQVPLAPQRFLEPAAVGETGQAVLVREPEQRGLRDGAAAQFRPQPEDQGQDEGEAQGEHGGDTDHLEPPVGVDAVDGEPHDHDEGQRTDTSIMDETLDAVDDGHPLVLPFGGGGQTRREHPKFVEAADDRRIEGFAHQQHAVVAQQAQRGPGAELGFGEQLPEVRDVQRSHDHAGEFAVRPVEAPAHPDRDVAAVLRHVRPADVEADVVAIALDLEPVALGQVAGERIEYRGVDRDVPGGVEHLDRTEVGGGGRPVEQDQAAELGRRGHDGRVLQVVQHALDRQVEELDVARYVLGDDGGKVGGLAGRVPVVRGANVAQQDADDRGDQGERDEQQRGQALHHVPEVGALPDPISTEQGVASRDGDRRGKRPRSRHLIAGRLGAHR